MNLENYTARLRDDLRAAAALGDEQTRATAEALADAAQTSARLMLLAALSDLATEVSEHLDNRTVHLSSNGTDVSVDVRPEHGPEHATGSGYPTFDEMTGDISRVTLRLVEQIKSKAEEAAAQNGQSLNSWLSHVVQGALRDQTRWSGPSQS